MWPAHHISKTWTQQRRSQGRWQWPSQVQRNCSVWTFKASQSFSLSLLTLSPVSGGGGEVVTQILPFLLLSEALSASLAQSIPWHITGQCPLEAIFSPCLLKSPPWPLRGTPRTRSLAFKALLKGLSYPKSPQFLLIFYYCPAQPLGDQSVHQPSPRAVDASCQPLITSHVPGWHSLIKGPTSPPSPDWLLLPGHSGLSEISWLLICLLRLIGKDPDAGKDWRQEKGMTEDEMVGWHHWLNGHHEFEQTPGAGERQGSLAYCSSWGGRVRHHLMTEQQQSPSSPKGAFNPHVGIGHNLLKLSS